MEFSPEEIERYARHLVLRDVGGPGQQRLKRARLLVIGAGGLGAPVLAYCAAAGVGRIGIADHDAVALSDLQRQVIHGAAAIGEAKVDSARRALAALNPNVKTETHELRLTEDNAAAIIERYDIVADCTDSAPSRYVVSDACFRARRPLVTASVGQFDGSLTTLKPYQSNADGEPNPTYRCLFPDAPAAGAAPTCAEVGVLGPLAGVVGALQAVEIVKEIAGIGSSLVGRLLLVDGRDLRFETIAYRWDPANPLNGRNVAAEAVGS